MTTSKSSRTDIGMADGNDKLSIKRSAANKNTHKNKNFVNIDASPQSQNNSTVVTEQCTGCYYYTE